MVNFGMVINGMKKEEKIKNNRDYWIPKIEKNMKRDKKYNKELKKMGWKVLRFWNNEVMKDSDKCLNIINGTLPFIS